MKISPDGDTGGRAYEKVIHYVQEQIVLGKIMKGQKLPPERELAEKLQVGRNSVREALRTLSLMGFISSTQGSGNYVSCDFEKSLTESMHMLLLLNQTNYREVSELRQGIETQAIRLASERISQGEIERLKEIIKELRESKEEAKNVVLDKELHFIIASASGNRMILQLLQALSETLDQFISNMRGKILMQSDSRDELQKSHEEIVASLCERDTERAVNAMHAHFTMIDNAITQGNGSLIS